MVTFQIVDHVNDLNDIFDSYAKDGWEINPINSGALLNDQGREVSGYYCGRSYEAQACVNKKMIYIEKVMRVFLGILATLVTLGLALCVRSVRNLFTQDRKVICVVVEKSASDPDRTLNGMEKAIVVAFKVDNCCNSGQCGQENCTIQHEKSHACTIRTNDGQVHNVSLSDIEIRDHLEWLEPSIVEADYSHFSHAGEISV